MKALHEVDTFGGIDADADTLLDECFQDHEAYLEAVAHKRPVVLGRKGSGKTAIFRKIIRTRKHDFFSFGHTFSDYPWHHHNLQAQIGVPEELRYVQSWQYLILLTTAKLLLNQDQSQPWSETAQEELSRIEKFVVDSYGTRDPDVTQLFSPAKRLRIRPHIRIGKEWADLGLDLERLPVSDLPRVLQEVNANVSRAVVECLNPELDYFVCFDELDRGFDLKSATYGNMLIGLLLAAKLLNDQARNAGKRFSVVVFLRDDIYQTLKFEDKNKVSETLVSRIEWDSARTKWTLQALMERRFEKVIGDGAKVPWSTVFDELHQMPGRQTKYQHMLDRTFRRPRDIIKFSNEVLHAFKARGQYAETTFTNDDVSNARAPYSEYLLRELEDEVHKHLPAHEEYFEILRAVGTGLFGREELESTCKKRPDLLKDGSTPIQVLRQLFEFSVVAYQKTGGVGGGSEYVWRHIETRARFDEAAVYFRVHPGLVEALGLKRYGWKKQGGGADADAEPA
ncbi:MAG: hypothetical protein QM704_00450 [Anaeromyxobacteraceae bacterium]